MNISIGGDDNCIWDYRFTFATQLSPVIIIAVMSTISLDDVYYVAALSKIAVSDSEAQKLQHELDAILGYVKQLDTIDTTDVEPTYQVTGLKNVMCDDDIIDYDVSPEELLANAPTQQEGQIKVPKVL